MKRFRLNFPRLFLASTKPTEEPTGKAESEQLPEEVVLIKEEGISRIEEENPRPTPQQPENNTQGGVGVFSTPSGLKEFFVEVLEKQKPLFLAHLVKKMGHTKILCFTNSRETTKRLAFLLSRFNGINAEALNAGMPLPKRTRLLSSFAEGEIQVSI